MVTGEIWIPGCVTITVRETPPPVTVIVPLLNAVPVFAVAVIVMFPFPVLLDGDTVSHDAALLDAVQDTFDVTDTLVLAAADDVGFHVAALSVRFAAFPGCVTAIVREAPPPVTVIAPLLAAVPVLAVALIVMFPLFVPLDGDTVSHDGALLDAVQDTFDVTDTLVLAAADNDGGFHIDAPSVKFGCCSCANCATMDTLSIIE